MKKLETNLPNNPDNAIEITQLDKIYAPRGKQPEKRALDNINLAIKRGSIFGLLGPNGAGKSTLINILAGLVLKSSGKVSIWGRDIEERPRNAKLSIGIVPQEINFDPYFTPKKLLDLQAGMYGVPTAERRTMELLTLMGLADKADSYSRSLSGGMKRRLMVAKAMVHSPPILVLDEPTAGVDIELRQQLWDNVRALNKAGATIVLTTHYLEEAEELCDEIAIINHGRIIAHEPTRDLLGRIEQKSLQIFFREKINAIPTSLLEWGAQITGENSLKVRYAPKDNAVGAILAAVQQSGLYIIDMTTEQTTLEDVFLQLTSEKKRAA